MNNNFLPSTYDVPSKSSNYMRFTEGENKFRILCSPIIGWEAWETSANGTRKPLRRPMDNPFSVNEIDDPETIKHFWAMVVYNYDEEKIQILEITQKGLQKKIKTYANDQDWGSPLNYDLVVTRTGKDITTKYDVIAKPVRKVSLEIEKVYQNTYINLFALYNGEDPFLEVVEPNAQSGILQDTTD